MPGIIQGPGAEVKKKSRKSLGMCLGMSWDVSGKSRKCRSNSREWELLARAWELLGLVSMAPTNSLTNRKF